MAGVTFSGLASGLDTASIIDALMGAAREPVRRLESRKADYNSKISALSEVMGKLSTLRSAAMELDTAGEFRSFSAQSSDSDTLGATADSSASAGVYQIEIDRLAQPERSYSTGFGSKDQTGAGFGSGTLGIQVGSDTVQNISIDDSVDTLEDVAARINDQVTGVSADVIYNGSEYQLLVQGDEMGAASDVGLTFSEGAGVALSITEGQGATDAQVRFDTVTINSNDNQIADAIPGVTLDLNGTTTSALTLTVEADFDQVESKVSAFVEAYNAVVSTVNSQFSFGGAARSDTLVGDSSVRNVKGQLQSIVSGQVSAVSGEYDALSRVGVTSNRDGTLSLNTADLRAALADDFDGVVDLFAYTDGDSATDNDGVAVRLERSIDLWVRATDGLLYARKEGLGDSIDTIDDRISALERRLESYEEGLVRQYTNLETTIAQFQRQGNFLSMA